MNQTIELQLNHRTIREFTDQPVSSTLLNEIFEVANHTASSSHLQGFSMIRITDSELKKKLAKIAKQEYLTRVPELIIFIVDQYRNNQIGLEQGFKLEAPQDMNSFIQSFTDACLAAQNMTIAIESCGLGAVYFGSILNDIPELIKLLELPPLTYPVVGLGFGYPNQKPQLKPRLPFQHKLFENTYEIKKDYLDLIASYDEELHQYYDLRDANNRVDTFRDQIIKKMKDSNPSRSKVFQYLKSQGFNVDD